MPATTLPACDIVPTSSTDANLPRIAIIGGGISGLTAAYRLTKLLPDAQLELFEASDRLGGVLKTQIGEDYLLELGADSFIRTIPDAVELCEELGLGGEIIPTNDRQRRALVLHRGKLHPVPQGFVQMRPERLTPMLTTPLLSWQGKLRLLAERFIPARRNTTPGPLDESVASFFTRRLGREVFERLVQPLLAGIYTADPYKLSVAATMPSALQAEQKYGSLVKAALAARKESQTSSNASGARYASFVTLKGGLAQLIVTLQEQLHGVQIHHQVQVRSIRKSTDQTWLISTNSGDAHMNFDGVVVALPAPRAAEAIESFDTELAAELGSIPYASSAVAGLIYRRNQVRDTLDGFGMVVPSVEGRKIVAASYSSVKFPGRAPDDQVVLRVFVGGALQPELLELADDKIVTLAKNEIAEILRIEGEPLHSELVRWQEKMPQYHVGHVQLVDSIERRVSAHPGLVLAGNAYRGVGIPQCVKAGNMAARNLAETLQAVHT